MTFTFVDGNGDCLAIGETITAPTAGMRIPVNDGYYEVVSVDFSSQTALVVHRNMDYINTKISSFAQKAQQALEAMLAEEKAAKSRAMLKDEFERNRMLREARDGFPEELREFVSWHNNTPALMLDGYHPIYVYEHPIKNGVPAYKTANHHRYFDDVYLAIAWAKIEDQDE